VTKYGVPRDGEAEAGSTAAHCSRAAINSFNGIEPLKDARKVHAINANAVIDYGELRSTIAQWVDFDLYSSTLAAVFHGVMNKVRHRLAKAISVASDQQWTGCQYINATAMLCCDWGKPLCDLFGQRDQVKLDLAQRNFTRFERGQIEHLISHLNKVEHLYLNLGALGYHSRHVTLRGCTSNGFSEEANRRERSA
jgi:hypothetical protein